MGELFFMVHTGAESGALCSVIRKVQTLGRSGVAERGGRWANCTGHLAGANPLSFTVEGSLGRSCSGIQWWKSL